MERVVGGIFIEAAMPPSCSHSCRQFLTIIQTLARTESENPPPPSVAKIAARYTLSRILLDCVHCNRSGKGIGAEKCEPLSSETSHQFYVPRRSLRFHVLEEIRNQLAQRDRLHVKLPKQFRLLTVFQEIAIALICDRLLRGL